MDGIHTGKIKHKKNQTQRTDTNKEYIKSKTHKGQSHNQEKNI